MSSLIEQAALRLEQLRRAGVVVPEVASAVEQPPRHEARGRYAAASDGGIA